MAAGSGSVSDNLSAYSFSKPIRLVPIIVLFVYLNLSIFIFFFGPWEWPLDEPMKLITFLFAAHLALVLGYLSAAFAEPRGYNGAFTPVQLAWIGTLVTLALFIPTSLWVTGGDIDFSGSFADPAEAYRRYQEVESAPSKETGFITYVRVLMAVPLALPIPLIVYYWRQLSYKARIAGVACIFAVISQYVLTGRNKGLSDFVLFIPWFVALRIFSAKRSGSNIRYLLISVILGSLLLSGFLSYYRRNIQGRTDGDDQSDFTQILSGMYTNEDNFMLKAVPENARFLVRSFTFTQTHGYFALYLALDLPFESAFPVGHSYFFQTLEQRFTGNTTLADHSYTSRLSEMGLWHKTLHWHTTYTWFASDVSFVGVVVLVFLLGRMLAMSWLDALRGDNPYGVVMFITFVTICYYIPTNNIVFGFPESVSAFWCTLALWLRSRRLKK